MDRAYCSGLIKIESLPELRLSACNHKQSLRSASLEIKLCGNCPRAYGCREVRRDLALPLDLVPVALGVVRRLRVKALACRRRQRHIGAANAPARFASGYGGDLRVGRAGGGWLRPGLAASPARQRDIRDVGAHVVPVGACALLRRRYLRAQAICQRRPGESSCVWFAGLRGELTIGWSSVAV